jgi:predicted TPR repeat methyltransferase
LGRANALRALQRRDEAAAAYRQAGEEGADAQLVGSMMALLGAAPMPAAPPAAYVAGLFDQYAGHFDVHLQDVLAYRTPALLEALLGPAAGLLTIDLGCGTGLCGPWLRRVSHTLEGVDLSPAMLEQARATGCYDKLACADLAAYLEGRAGIDLLAAADVFVYLGELGPAIRAMAACLGAGGRIVFSVEECAEGPVALRPSGRYAHGEEYLRALAADHGLQVRQLDRAVLREDGGAPVPGLLVLLARPD